MAKNDFLKELMKKIDKLEDMGDKLANSDGFNMRDFREYQDYFQSIKDEITEILGEAPHIFSAMRQYATVSSMLIINTHAAPRAMRIEGLELMASLMGTLQRISRSCVLDAFNGQDAEKAFLAACMENLDKCIKIKYEEEQESAEG